MDKTIQISTGTIVKTVLILFGCYLLYVLKDTVLVIIASLTLTAAIEPGNRFLMNLKLPWVKFKIPRIISVVIMFAFVIGVVILFAAFFMPTLVNDTKQLLNSLPEYVTTIDEWSASFFGEDSAFSITEYLYSFKDSFDTSSILELMSTVFGGSFNFVLVVVLTFYFSTQEDGIAKFIEMITRAKNKNYVVGLWRRCEKKIGSWLQGQLLLGVIIGILTYLLLYIVGVESAMFLAVIAGVFELIPIFGLVLSLIPAVAIGFIEGGLSLAIVVFGVYMLIQQFENHLIYPLIVQKVVGIPPVIVIIALIAGAQLAGFFGVLLSVPVSAVLIELLNDWSEKKIGV